MSTLKVIGEFFQSWETAAHRAAARDLTHALAEVAPRGYGASMLVASDTKAPELDSPKAQVDKMPLRSSILPMLWQTSAAARPLDGDFVHSLTPLIPLRSHAEDDGTQTTVTVPHTLAWDDPQIMPKSQARLTRLYTRRAIKRADVIMVPSHAIAERLREIYGTAATIQVLPLAAPEEFLADNAHAARRKELGLPERYLLTTAHSGDYGRLEWLLRAYEVHGDLPPLVVLNYIEKFDPSDWAVLGDRVIAHTAESLSDIGAVIGGAELLALPQQGCDSVYHLYGALAQGVPVLHAGATTIAEIALDASVGEDDEQEFAHQLTQLTTDAEELRQLSVHARDRSRTYSWHGTAWHLWEIHANI